MLNAVRSQSGRSKVKRRLRRKRTSVEMSLLDTVEQKSCGTSRGRLAFRRYQKANGEVLRGVKS